MPGADDNKDLSGTGAADDKKPNLDATGSKTDEGADDTDAGLGFKTVEEAAAEIKKLRKENAQRRTSNKTLEERVTASEEMMGKMKQALGIENEEKPEVVVESLKGQNAALELELGISQLAVQNQISPDQAEYFSFLFHKELGSMKENEEMSDEQIAAIVKKAKGVGAPAAQKSTGIDNKGNPPPEGNQGDVTLEQFCKMNSGEKGALYQKNSALYERLFAEAKTKKLLR